MPELNWIGKSKIVTHHLEVPYRVLDRQFSFDASGQHEADNGSENMIIQGDNLEALKALLPQYEGKVDLIYIDPPYNTGNEGWVYNDNVNDPQIKKWLGTVVGSEEKDLSRHDKWLCMMYPRLRLLHRLMAPSGLIAVSIGDHEFANLGVIMNEIFGSANRLAYAPVRSEPSGGKDKSVLRTGHEYLLIYTKGDQSKLQKEEKQSGELNLQDQWGEYKKGRELRKWGATSDRSDRETMWFSLTAPDGTVVYPIKNDGSEGYWRWGLGHDVMSLLIDDPAYAHWEKTPYEANVSVDGETERWVPYEKDREVTKSFGWNTWLDGYGTNSDATDTIKKIFGSKEFDTPKPVQLLEWLISLHSNTDALILDSFAGSGTTAQAVLNLNQHDEGNRHFILVELGDYADGITAERVRRTITGYTGQNSSEVTLFEQKLTTAQLKKMPTILAEAERIAAKAEDQFEKAPKPKLVTRNGTGKTSSSFIEVVGTRSQEFEVPGTGGSFSFYELGAQLLHEDEINPEVPVSQVRDYIWYMETGHTKPAAELEVAPYFLGIHNQTAYHFAYELESVTSLDRNFLATLTNKTVSESMVVYADLCLLSTEELAKLNITYKKIPRDITRL